jgi:hypothetical protein
VTLERNGLIRPQPGVARTIQILVAPEELPILAAIMHDVTRFHECVERTSGGNPTGWIGVMRLAVQRVWG